MKKIKKYITIILTICMVVGLVPTSVIQVSAEGLRLNVNQQTEVVISEANEKVIYEFVPEENGIYRFFSTGNVDSYGQLYLGHPEEAGAEELAYDDDTGGNGNFSFSCELIAGNSYYFAASACGDITGNYIITVENIPVADGMEITAGDVLTGYMGGYENLYVEFTPENAVGELVTWTSSNDSIATVSHDGTVKFLSEGIVTITATSETGLVDSIEITVLGIPEITFGEVKQGTLDGNTNGIYTFTPTVSGTYEVCIENTRYIGCDVYDENDNSIACAFEEQNPRLQCTLEAGKTYRISVFLCDVFNAEYSLWIEQLEAAESMNIICKDTTVYEGEKVYLKTEFLPANSITENVIWTSSDTSIATVDEWGTVCFKAPGQVKISAVSADTGLKNSVDFEVLEATELSYQTKVTNRISKENETKVYKFTPDSDGDYALIIENENGLFCEMTDSEGNYCASDSGYNLSLGYSMKANETYYIELDAWNNNTSYNIWIDDLVSATEIDIIYGGYKSVDCLTGYAGEGIWLDVTFSPYNSKKESVTWTSSNSSVVTVSEYGGYVKFLSSGTATIAATSENGLLDSVEIEALEPEELSLDEIADGTIQNNGDYVMYTFTPEEDGAYGAYIDSTKWTGCSVLDSYNSELSWNSGYEYKADSYMNAGETYFIKVYLHDDTYVEYNIEIKKLDPAESMYIVQGDEILGYEGQTAWIGVSFEPVDAATESVTYVSSNPSVATVETWGEVQLLSVGETTITATSQNGLTDTIKVVVKSLDDIPALEEGTSASLYLKSGNERLYKFIPSENGIYKFYSIDGMDSYAELLDEDFNNIMGDDDTGRYSNFAIISKLEAGKTYYCSVGTYIDDSFDVQVDKLLDITSLELISPPTKKSYYEGAVSYINYNGLQLQAILEDGSVVNWSYEDNKELAGFPVTFSWVYDEEIDEEITVYVECGEKEVSFTLDVEESPVASIEIESGKMPELIENVDGWEDPGFFVYDVKGIKDITFLVTYTDGTTKAGCVGDCLDEGYYITYSNNQWDKPWHLGNDNYITVSYLGASVDVPVTIVENPVESLELITAPSKVYVWGDAEWGHLEDGSYSLWPEDFTGLSFAVHYKDGTTVIFDDEDIDEREWSIDEHYFYIDYDGSDVSVEDDVNVTFRYMNHSFTYDVSLTESSVSSIAVVKDPDVTTYMEGYAPTFIGMQLEVFYTDGTSKVVEVTEDNISYDIDTARVYVDFNGYKVIIGDDIDEVGNIVYQISCLGAVCYYDEITFSDEKVISSIDVYNYINSLENTIFTISYSDGTTENITLEWLSYIEGTFWRHGFANTSNGILFVESYYASDDDTWIYILGNEIDVEVPNVLLGDVTEDGKVNIRDVMKLKEYLADSENVSINTDAADMDGNGKLNIRDVMKLKEYLASH